ncbi:MAG: hypothetical protein WD848_07905 [Dehalococcoidia bacterium]
MNSKVSQEPTAADAVLGVAALGIVAIDFVLMALLIAGTFSPAGEWDLTLYMVAIAVLGLGAGIGIIMRSLLATGWLAAPWPPVVLTAVRVGLLALVWPIPWLQWEGWESGFLATFPYLVPTTVLLILLSLVNLSRRRSASGRRLTMLALMCCRHTADGCNTSSCDTAHPIVKYFASKTPSCRVFVSDG